jgi:hypothetical protein
MYVEMKQNENNKTRNKRGTNTQNKNQVPKRNSNADKRPNNRMGNKQNIRGEKTKMNKETQTQLWKKINEPKVEGLISIKNLTPPELLKLIPKGKTAEIIDGADYMLIIDRPPKITRQRRKN